MNENKINRRDNIICLSKFNININVFYNKHNLSLLLFYFILFLFFSPLKIKDKKKLILHSFGYIDKNIDKNMYASINIYI